MRLFVTGEEFVMNGVPYSGIPFLCDKEMELVSAPNQYLRYVAVVRGRTRSPRTWQTYGHHLYEYIAFLQANDLAWDVVNQSQIAAWRDEWSLRSWIINDLILKLETQLKCKSATKRTSDDYINQHLHYGTA